MMTCLIFASTLDNVTYSSIEHQPSKLVNTNTSIAFISMRYFPDKGGLAAKVSSD